MNPKPPGPLTLLARSRKARWWVAVIVGLLVLYVASFGPVVWYVGTEPLPSLAIVKCYGPLADLAVRDQGWSIGRSIGQALSWYVCLFSDYAPMTLMRISAHPYR